MNYTTIHRRLHTLAGLVATAVGSACFAQGSPTFDFNGDGTPDRIEYDAAQEVVRVHSGANNAVLQTFAAPTAGEGFGTSAMITPDLSGDFAPDLVVGAPLANAAGQPRGRVYALRLTGAVVWEVLGPEGARVGYEIGTVVDQSGDGIPDILAGRSATGVLPTQEAALFSGRTGQLLAVRSGSLATLKAFTANGGRLFAAADLDDSGAVDQNDLFEYLYLHDLNDARADMDGDGIVNANDLVSFFDDLVNGVITIQALAAPTQQVNAGGNGGPAAIPSAGCKTCEAIELPPICQSATNTVSLSCPAATIIPGDCVVLNATGNCEMASPWCWYATFTPTGTGDEAQVSPVRLENSGATATFCPGVPGTLTVAVHRTCRVGNTDCPACDTCTVVFAYPPSCDIDLLVKVVQAPNGAQTPGGGLNGQGPFADPRAVAPGTTGWVDVTGTTPIWREGIIVEGRPAGGQFEVDFIETIGSDTYTYNLGNVSSANGGPLARAWQGPSLPDADGASRAWIMFRTASQLPEPGRREARFRIRYSIHPCGTIETIPTTDAVFFVAEDTDGDHIPNYSLEGLGAGSNPNPPAELCTFQGAADTDGDGTTDEVEIQLGSDPCLHNNPPVGSNWDRDHLLDYSEAAFWRSSRDLFDTDSDGVQDDAEVALGFSPWNRVTNDEPGISIDGQRSEYLEQDVERDALFDAWEFKEGFLSAIPTPIGSGTGLTASWPSHPSAGDQDYDGIMDGLEMRLGMDPLVSDQNPTAPMWDTDGDGLSNEVEERMGSNPNRRDTDGDGVSDGYEARNGSDARLEDSDFDGMSDGAEDTDGDGVTDAEESRRCLNPRSNDTDGDGIPDATDPLPLVPGPHGPQCPRPGSLPVAFTIGLAPNGTGFTNGTFRLGGAGGSHDGIILNGPGSQVSCCTEPDPPCDLGPPPHAGGCTSCLCNPGTAGTPNFVSDTWYNYTITVPCGGDGRPALTPWMLANLAGTHPCFDLVPEWDPNGNGLNRSSGSTSVPMVGCSSCSNCGNGGGNNDNGRCEPGSMQTYSGRVRFKLVPRYPNQRSVEIIIDDRNERGFEMPLPHEEKGDGKIILVDSSDPNEDQVPAFADFNSLMHNPAWPSSGPQWLDRPAQPLVPVIFYVKAPVACDGGVLSTHTITITYPQSSPSIVQGPIVPLGINRLDYFAGLVESGAGTFRLWRPLPNQATIGTVRNPADVGAGGQFVSSGTTYDIATLVGGPVVAGTEYPITLFLEAVSPSATACGDAIQASVNFGTSNPSPPRPDCTGQPGACGLPDFATIIAARIDVVDGRYLSVQRVQSEGIDAVRFTNASSADLSSRFLRVGGAIADGASVCLVTMKPPPSAEMAISLHVVSREAAQQPVCGIIHQSDLYEATFGGLSGVARSTQIGSIDLTTPAFPVSSSPRQDQWSRSVGDFSGNAVFAPPLTFRSTPPSGCGFSLGSGETSEIGFQLVHRSVPIGTHRFLLRRPPLVLVHGYAGGSESYWGHGAYDESAGIPVPTRMYYVDYSESSYAGFDRNFGSVALAIRSALYDYRTANDSSTLLTEVSGSYHAPGRGFGGIRFAATRADVVAHSMGTQLTRLYISNVNGSAPRVYRTHFSDINSPWVASGFARFNIARSETEPLDSLPSSNGRPTEHVTGQWWYLREDNYFAGDISRFVAIGGPFRGSPIGDYFARLLDPNSRQISGRSVAGLVMTGDVGNPVMALALWQQNATSEPDIGANWTAISDLARDSVAQYLAVGVAPSLFVEPGNPSSRGAGTTASPPTGRRAVRWLPLAGRCTLGADPYFIERLLSGAPLIVNLPGAVNPALAELDAGNSDGVVEVTSQLNGRLAENIEVESIVSGHQHMRSFPDALPAETYSETMSQIIGRWFSLPVDDARWQKGGL